MKLVCEILLPDNADHKTKLDAMAQAGRDESKWRVVHTRESRKQMTDLENKCGTCKFFRPFTGDKKYLEGCGECDKGHVWGARTRPKCKSYERKSNG